MRLDCRRHVVCVLLGLTLLLFFLMMMLTRSLVQPVYNPRLVIPTSKLSREADAVPMNLLHSSIERQLIHDHLPVNTSQKGWRLWQRDFPGSSCSKYMTRFGVKMPRVWLVSFPCSGNTWTRYLLEAASGIFTGSVYSDRVIFNNGFLGERDRVTSMRTLVQKTHGSSFLETSRASLSKLYQATNMSIPTVLLLRNPANAIISYFKFVTSENHTGQLPENIFNTKLFHDRVNELVRRWMQLALDHLLWTEAPLHVVHYERLVQDTFEELTSLLAFLGVPKDEGRMACISSHLDGKFKRRNNKSFSPYTDEEKISLAAAAKAVNRTLQLLGYAPLPPYN